MGITILAVDATGSPMTQTLTESESGVWDARSVWDRSGLYIARSGSKEAMKAHLSYVWRTYGLTRRTDSNVATDRRIRDDSGLVIGFTPKPTPGVVIEYGDNGCSCTNPHCQV